MSQALKILSKYWQHPSFREPQEEIITNVLAGNDTFALLPTGAGKSICFQVPALVLEGTCLVVSPLIALIEDQVSNLKKRGIKATSLLGGMNMQEIDAVFDNCTYGGYKFLYLSPEQLQRDWILDRITKLKINLIAIDEAHCISQWGNDFRPAYLQLSVLKQHFTSQPFIALTASANKKTIEDIVTILQLDHPGFYTKSFTRANLAYGVYKVDNKLQMIERIFAKNPLPTIIYTRNRKETEHYAQQLTERGLSATFFHGGLSSHEKKKRLERWTDEKELIIVATNAFGMGIDKGNVKNVIHVQIPESLEGYYQEAGRAGRNGLKAFSTILLSGDDIARAEATFKAGLFDKEFLKLVYRKLNNYLQIAYGEGFDTAYFLNFNNFCTQYKFPKTKTYNALQFLDRQGILKLDIKAEQKSQLYITVSNSVFFDHVEDDENQENLLIHLTRNYQGILEDYTAIDIPLISKETNLGIDVVTTILNDWEKAELCQFNAGDHDLKIVFTEPWEEDRTIIRTFSYLEKQNTLKAQQFEAMLFFVKNEDICKNNILLRYFGETPKEDCKQCSSCLKKEASSPALDIKNMMKDILALISSAPIDFPTLQNKLSYTDEETILTLQHLLETDKIEINNKNQYILR